ncbi:Inosine-5'-monophosphate dehydrogenase [Posidoniimonas polymericola]|uniref:Inosine-5'-monophosphate dehydrogenase n=1 Tax=Posidoniimonas polymericola TaxID=2528002 RepID=A0A5C5YQ18_9BACT|nr:CBS domain-containing protein [Posidoniimonas polymericola]TWT76996.1 Inosine-5'-monophosphate dehydrogenase [Posidoniimonas polymericola]
MISIAAEDIMVKRLVTLSPAMDVHDAVKLLLRNRISGAPVVDTEGRYLGVFSERCCLGVILDAAYEQLPTYNVGAFMDTEAKTISADTQLLSIAQVFLLSSARRLPVVDEENRLLGQISRRDVIQAAMKQLDQGPRRESSVLYLSALADRFHAPIN